ncbi:hypothetical protein ATANTOWER_016418 [Ataeniobius toweri]|uniref:Glia maturation factor beta n=1 Tax=Ataeniobius toweri TaxID=208326 RepID=A0ABU7CGW7_9TELE|nr:hypothetical protein [Ataeniobius toweri]
MSESLVVCDVHEDLVKKLKEFRFRKETNNAAIIMKIDKEKQLVILEEEHEDISPDELKDELPERQPRYPFELRESEFISINMMMDVCLIRSASFSPVQWVADRSSR